MAMQLDSRSRLLWRDPFTVQFGSGPKALVIEEVGEPEARLLRALQLGFAPGALRLVCSEIGLDAARATSLVQQLSPVMQEHLSEEASDTASAFTVLVEGPGGGQSSVAASRLAYEVRAQGWAGAPTQPLSRRPNQTVAGRSTKNVAGGSAQQLARGPAAQVVVLVAAHALAPERVIRWHGSSLPQLPVVFDDEGVLIGPVLSPIGACLRCLELHRLERDSCWPALATQLLGEPAAAEDGVLLLEAVSAVCRILHERAEGQAILLPEHTALRIERDGRRELLRLSQHEGCGCRQLARIDHLRLPEPQLAQEP